MGNTTTNELIRLMTLLIPIVLLFGISAFVRFDPNRRVLPPSHMRQILRVFEQPWGIISTGFMVMIALLLGITASVLFGLPPAQIYQRVMPHWMQITTPTLSVLYLFLVFVAFALVLRLKFLASSIWD